MKNLFILCLFSFFSLSASAEFSLDDLSLKKVTDLEGWTPRYVYVEDDNITGRTHYAGVSYFERQGAGYDGPTLRVGLGKRGEKVNIAYTSGFSLMAVDIGLSYILPDKNKRRNIADNVEGVGIELGLRFWVVQLIAIHTEKTSYVSLGYGF